MNELALAYLFAYMFFLGLALGSLALLMLQHLTGGAWGLVIRRPLEAAVGTLPLLLILFVPVALSLHLLYPWTHADHHFTGFKHDWLTQRGWLIRTSIYFAVWLLLSGLFRRWSAMQDRSADESIRRRQTRLAGPGLVLWGVSITFAAVDWIMSLDPHWFSAIWGMIFMAGQALSALALAILVLVRLRGREPLAHLAGPERFHDLGNLLLAFTMVWAYLSFSQYLIIWSANVQEETPFYVYRTAGGWKFVALALIVLHFFVPFILLLSRKTKRAVNTLAKVAALILIMRLVDLFWVIVPNFAQGHPERFPVDQYGPSAHLRELLFGILALTVIGLPWAWLYRRNLNRRPLVPVHDPRLEEVSAAHA